MKEKAQIIKECHDYYCNNDYVVVVDFKGMNASDMSAFRGDLKLRCGCKFFVIKNTLNKVAARGTDFGANINFSGQCGVIFCNDVLNVAKVINDFCFKTQRARLVGCFNKSEVCGVDYIKEMASLPSLEVVRTQLLCMLNSVGSSVLRAIVEKVKKEGGSVD